MSADATAATATIPVWVTAALGADLTDAIRVPWGFTNETWGATTSTGERYAVTSMGSAAAFVLRHGPEIACRVGAAGIRMPAPLPPRSNAAQGVVVSAWV